MQSIGSATNALRALKTHEKVVTALRRCPPLPIRLLLTRTLPSWLMRSGSTGDARLDRPNWTGPRPKVSYDGRPVASRKYRCTIESVRP
jgi:hypothetical protein